MSQDEGSEKTDPSKGSHQPSEKSLKSKKGSEYTALEFVSSSSQTNSVDTEDGHSHKEVDLEHLPEDERVLTALIALTFEAFKLVWSLGVAYWYYWSGNYTATYIITIVFLISGFCTHLVYFVSR